MPIPRLGPRACPADAFVFVTPEYNYAPPPALVNALNYLSREWNYAPVGFVSYGGISGGLRSVQVAKQIVTTLKMMPIPEGVPMPMVFQNLDEAASSSPSTSTEPRPQPCSMNSLAGRRRSNRSGPSAKLP